MISFDENLTSREKSKADLRAEAKEVRTSFAESVLGDISAKICDGVISLPEFCEADAVFCYSALKGEICTDGIVCAALSLGKTLAFPRCYGNGSMDFFAVSSLEALSVGAFGIKEPSSRCRLVGTRDFDRVLVIVPALVFDRFGYRIGWGKGYYDRYFELRQSGVTLVGVCPDALLQGSIPHDEFDVPAQIIVSEKEVLRIEDI